MAWIADGTAPSLAITSAIPPIFDAYATVDVPSDEGDRREQDRVLLDMLATPAPWWLGYLDTGADDVVFTDVPMVTLYAGWHYVLVEAGPQQAADWKDPSSWRGELPDLIFPAERSWLVSTLWDDEWRCVGGAADLIERLGRDARVRARPVDLGSDATPPGHDAR